MADKPNVPRRYGQWAGNSQGQAADPTLCIEEVYESRGGWPTFRQCQRKRGHGPEGLRCKQHAKKLAEREAAWEEDARCTP